MSGRPAKTGFFTTIAMVVFIAAGLRLTELPLRPMHGDEAVNAFRFGPLLESGSYIYDPAEYHGPTLPYFTLWAARIFGLPNLAGVSEGFLRLVPALFGILLVGMPLFFTGTMGKKAVIFSMLSLAVSPAMVFYSRYYIHEMLLVLFTAILLGCLWKIIQTGKWGWAAGAGISAALMYASKETALLAFAAVVFSVVVSRPSPKTAGKSVYLVVVISFVLVWALMFSSFGNNLNGLMDSIRSIFISFQRAAGGEKHLHPWYYYLKILAPAEGITIILSFFLPLSLCFTGNHCRQTRPNLSKWLSIFTVFLLIFYSLIPYKTPWCIVSCLYGMCLMSGIVLEWLIDRFSRKWLTWTVVILVGCVSPLFQSMWLNFRLYASPSNPYVYAHPTEKIADITNLVGELAAELDKQGDFSIQIIASGGDYWPLPWYLRQIARIGYWPDVSMGAFAPIIFVKTEMESQLMAALDQKRIPGQKHLYMPLFEDEVQFRPGVFWQGYIRKDYYDLRQGVSNGPMQPQSKMENPIMNLDISTYEQKPIRFSHEAMATVFELYLCCQDAKVASGAARAAFAEVDKLESELSRYIDNSDISRINRLQPGQEAVVSPETMDCLLTAKRMAELTGGAFDPTVGKTADSNKQGMKNLVLDKDISTVHIVGDSVSLDLGAIGKGYALDKMSGVLREWKITSALLNAGASTVLAMEPPEGQPGWTAVIRNPRNLDEVIYKPLLKSKALSCSSVDRRAHIINPFTGLPVEENLACWVIGSDAATCDALSTAFMVIEEDSKRAKVFLAMGLQELILLKKDGTLVRIPPHSDM